MSQPEADRYNAEQSAIFRQGHPEYYPSRPNLEALGDYFDRNGVFIVSALTLEKAYNRLDELGMLEHRPAPEPMPAPAAKLAPASKEAVQPSQRAESDLVEGWDLDSGEPRKWTQRQLDRLSATDYRKALRLYKNAFELPSRNW